MGNEPVPEGHRSGFVAVVGRPSVGKSTLINAYLGQVVAPVSPRPQTTRRRQLGILTLPDAQIIFVDTPGIHDPRHKLGDRLNRSAQEALGDADLILVVFDLTRPPTPEDERVAREVRSLTAPPPIVVALNKLDEVPADRLGDRQAVFHSLLPDALVVVALSALSGDGRQTLLDRVISLLPLGPRYYEADEVTDTYERDLAGELIRAAAMQFLRDEVPHGIVVDVEEFQEREGSGARILATMYVERESHKPIVIGKGGAMLKRIGTRARQEIEAMSGRKVFLELRVKTLPGWRDDPQHLRRLGFGDPGRSERPPR